MLTRLSNTLLRLEHHAGLKIKQVNYKNLPKRTKLCTSVH